MKRLFTLAAMFCLLLVLAFESNSSGAQEAKPQEKAKPTLPTITHAQHAYAKEFEKYGISDDYKNRHEPYGLSNKEKKEVNKLIDDSLAYLISRIKKNGEIEELQETPHEDAFKKLNKRKPDTWYAYYRGECVVELVRALLCTQQVELSKKDSQALIKALDFAMKKFSEVKFDIGHAEYLPYSLAEYAGRIVALDEELGTVPQTLDVKKARKSIKNEVKRCMERIIKTWTAEKVFYSDDLDHTVPTTIGVFDNTYSIVRAIAIRPDGADKERVKIAEGILEMLVDSAMVANDIKFARYVKNGDQAEEDEAATKTRDRTKQENNASMDAPIQWSWKCLGAKYYSNADLGRHAADALLMREKIAKKWEYVGYLVHESGAYTMFLDTYSFLSSSHASKYLSNDGRAIVERAKPMVWGVRAFFNQALGNISPEHSKRLSSQNISRLVSGGWGTHDSRVLESHAYDQARIATALKLTSFGKYDWYAETARLALRFRKPDGLVGSSISDKFDENAHAGSKFANNLYVLLLLRKQAVEEEKPGDSKPAEGDDKAPEKPEGDSKPKGEDKATKQD